MFTEDSSNRNRKMESGNLGEPQQKVYWCSFTPKNNNNILHFKNNFDSFIQEREAFVAKNKTNDSDTVSADKMSEFYKYFLDKNWNLHFYYNWSWYMKNLELLVLSGQVNVSKIYRKIFGKWFFFCQIIRRPECVSVSHYLQWIKQKIYETMLFMCSTCMTDGAFDQIDMIDGTRHQ